MPDYKTLLATLSSILLIIGIIPYFLDIYRRTTKPHAFTWGIWGVLTSIGFAVQLVSDAGIAVVMLGVTTIINFTIAGIGFWQKEIQFTKFDWISLSGAIFAILLWWITSNPLWAVILLAVSDTLAFLPTYRKAYYKPYQETATSFAIGTVATTLGILALENMTVVNWLYPAQIALSNLVLLLVLIIRRTQLKN